MTGSEALLAFFYCEARLSDICALAEDIEDDCEKAAFLHDYICENFEYDKELENDDIYSFLLEKKGTCRAYTMLYTALLRKCGIDATYAVREGDETAGHMWNEVVIDGVSYSVDVTWDDALSEENISREYFMTGKK
jgi:transglutaminase/protease-like cytokinesis protein 3